MLAVVHQPLKHNAALSVLANCLGELDVGLQKELAYAGVLSIKLPTEAEVWIGLDQRVRPPSSKKSLKVLVVLEPPDIKEVSTDGFDLVLTWQSKQLCNLPVIARLFVAAAPWLVPDEWVQLCSTDKIPGIGFLRGSKRKTAGHQLRHELWEGRVQLAKDVQLAIDFEEGGGVDRKTRNRQFHNQFVVVVENSRHDNYFTEKLLDALLARCVPIYWGCRNVGDFFDSSGIIELPHGGGLPELIGACRRLSGEDYLSRTEAMEQNFKRAVAYAGDFGQRIQRVVEDHLPTLTRDSAPFSETAAAGIDVATSEVTSPSE